MLPTKTIAHKVQLFSVLNFPQFATECNELSAIIGLYYKIRSLCLRVEVVKICGTLAMLPLHEAAHDGDVGKIQKLILQGCDPNQRDQDGETALHKAASYRYGRRDVIEALVKLSADPNARNRRGETPLHLASEGPDPQHRGWDFTSADPKWIESAEALLELGAEVNAIDERAATPLNWALSKGDRDDRIVKLLLMHGGTCASLL